MVQCTTAPIDDRSSTAACAVCGSPVPSTRRSLCSAECGRRQAAIRVTRAYEVKKAAGATRAVGDLNSTLYGPDRAGTVVVGGFGVGVHVSDGHLVVSTRDEGELRFSRLREHVGGVSQKMLTKTLRQLERDGLVTRRVHAVVPPRVDYKLTALGESLGESVCAVWLWVEAHAAEVARARRGYDDKPPRH